MSDPDLIERFQKDGYLVLEDYFDASLMDELDELIRGHFGADPEFWHTEEFLSEAKTEVIPWFPQREAVSTFDQIDDHEGLRQLTTDILGAGWRSDYCMVMFSKKGTSGQAWHQDCPPDDPAQFNLNRLVYTSDITDEDGGQVVLVPGSYRQGLLPAGDPKGHFPGEVILRPRKGTLVLLHGHTWHRVLPISGDLRFSTNYRAVSSAAVDDITDICVYRNMRYQFSTSSVIETRD